MNKPFVLAFKEIIIGPCLSLQSVCRDGYSVSNGPVAGFDNSEVLARLNEPQPLISADGNYQNEILKSVFNIGLKTTTAKPIWIVPNSIRQRSSVSLEKGAAGFGSVDSTLHRQFASLLNKDVKYILSFANKYGLLRRHDAHNLVFRNPSTGQQVQMGESLLWWHEEILDLASSLKLWDMILSKDKGLKDIILWHRDGIVIRLDSGDIQLVNRANMNLLTKWTRGVVRGPALYYLSLELNKRLVNSLTPRMTGLQEQEVYFYPDTLLSAIWLMFLLEINGCTRLLRCGVCGDYFSTLDPRARFCSTRCRMRNYRKHITRNSKRQRRKSSSGNLDAFTHNS